MRNALSHDLGGISTGALPLALFDLHHLTDVGESVLVRLPKLEEADLDAFTDGAGFASVTSPHEGLHELKRQRTLADTTAAGLRLLMVGLNPSLTASDLGYGFASPSNRFWKAAMASGLVTVAKDPRSIVEIDRVGMTDLVKRATPKAAEVKKAEFVDGLARLERIVRMLQPAVVCMAGVTGWRAATGARAELGVQQELLAGTPIYVMPNPSGLNAHTNHDDLVAHFQTALGIGDASSDQTT